MPAVEPVFLNVCMQPDISRLPATYVAIYKSLFGADSPRAIPGRSLIMVIFLIYFLISLFPLQFHILFKDCRNLKFRLHFIFYLAIKYIFHEKMYSKLIWDKKPRLKKHEHRYRKT